MFCVHFFKKKFPHLLLDYSNIFYYSISLTHNLIHLLIQIYSFIFLLVITLQVRPYILGFPKCNINSLTAFPSAKNLSFFLLTFCAIIVALFVCLWAPRASWMLRQGMQTIYHGATFPALLNILITISLRLMNEFYSRKTFISWIHLCLTK